MRATIEDSRSTRDAGSNVSVVTYARKLIINYSNDQFRHAHALTTPQYRPTPPTPILKSNHGLTCFAQNTHVLPYILPTISPFSMRLVRLFCACNLVTFPFKLAETSAFVSCVSGDHE